MHLAYALILLTLSGCRTSLDTGKKFRDEKDQRIATQLSLNANQERANDLLQMLQTTTATAKYVWVWRSNSRLIDYEAARKDCQDAGFDLPTEEMLTEAEQNERIKGAIHNNATGRDVFVRDRPKAIALMLLCVKN